MKSMMLLVEADERTREMCCHELHRLGMVVYPVRSIEEANNIITEKGSRLAGVIVGSQKVCLLCRLMNFLGRMVRLGKPTFSISPTLREEDALRLGFTGILPLGAIRASGLFKT